MTSSNNTTSPAIYPASEIEDDLILIEGALESFARVIAALKECADADPAFQGYSKARSM